MKILGLRFGREYADGEFCPDVRGPCVGRACKAWQNIKGRDPQSGEALDRWECVKYVWAPKLQVESLRLADSLGAAMESSRNENVASLGQLAQAIVNRPVLVQIPQTKLINE